jgi:hypothetical protein
LHTVGHMKQQTILFPFDIWLQDPITAGFKHIKHQRKNPDAKLFHTIYFINRLIYQNKKKRNHQSHIKHKARQLSTSSLWIIFLKAISCCVLSQRIIFHLILMNYYNRPSTADARRRSWIVKDNVISCDWWMLHDQNTNQQSRNDCTPPTLLPPPHVWRWVVAVTRPTISGGESTGRWVVLFPWPRTT